MHQRSHRILASATAALLAASLVLVPGCSGQTSAEENKTEAPTVQAFTPTAASQTVLETTTATRNTNATVSDTTVDYTELTLEQRDYYCDTANAQTATVLVYMCGADLESNYGAATADINEMIYGNFGSNVNVVVATGGSSKWQNSVIDADTNSYYHLTPSGLEPLQNVGLRDMTDPSTLQDFVTFGANAYPADRMMLIMWDHGGGTLGGFGTDEHFPTSASMSVTEIRDALTATDVKFDAVGFDACLMATIETAFALEGCADYLIASQRTEPASGWDYERWLGELSRNPSMPTSQLATLIIDDFIADAAADDGTVDATLSALDLTQLPALMSAMGAFFEGARTQMVADDFAEFSQARAEVAAGRSDDTQCDLVDLEYLTSYLNNVAGADELTQAINNCVICEDSNLNAPSSNGLNVYFPYNDITQYPAMANLYADLGFERSYFDFLSSFVTLMSTGQTAEGTATSATNEPTVDWSSYSWFDLGLAEESSTYITEHSYSPDSLTLVEKDGVWVLELSPEDWSLVTTIEQKVLYDDGGGYIDLGVDNMAEFNSAGDLLVTFDNTWVSLDGSPVCFYFATENFDTENWYTYGYAPALVNDELCDVVIRWDAAHETGFVAGYEKEATSLLASRGPVQFKEGDTIQYLCDYYTYDGEFDDTYLWGDPITYSKPQTVSYEDVGLGDCIVTYRLTDIYGNTYETESVSLSS